MKLVLAALLSLAGADPTGRFKFLGDCGGPDAVIHFTNVTFPLNVPNGDSYYVNSQFEVKAKIPGCAKVTTKIHKCSWIFNFCGYIPWIAGCQDDFGACEFNVCQRPGFPAFNPLFFACQGDGNGDTAQTTSVEPNQYQRKDRTYFPGLSGFEGVIVNGDYQMTVTYTSGPTVLGCYNMQFSVNNLPA